MKKIVKFLTSEYVVFVFLIISMVCIAKAATIFDKPQPTSYYGRTPQFAKFTAIVTPAPNDVNTISSTATSDEVLFAELRRIAIDAEGTDTDFTIIVKDDLGLTIFSKADCNTVLLPLTYALYTDDADGNNHLGYINAGPVMIDTNDVDPNNLISITITFYYFEPKY